MAVMNLQDVTAADDPRIAGYRNVRERDLVGREGLFIAEGKVVLRMLLAATRFAPESVLVLRRKLPGLLPELQAAPDLPIYVADDGVMDEITGFPVHRGILALGRRTVAPEAAALIAGLPSRAMVIVCVGISNHDNIGSIFRNAAAFGASAVLLDATCCDPLYRKALRVSVGGVLKTPYARFADQAELSGLLAGAGFEQYALSPGGALDIRALQPAHRSALYLGAEGPGLPAEVMARMLTVSIPISSSFDSLNVAAASAIAMFRVSQGSS